MSESEVLTKTLISSAQAPSEARRFLTGHELDWLGQLTLTDAEFLLSEIVSAAIRHISATEDVDVMIRMSDDVLWVGVSHPGPLQATADPPVGAQGSNFFDELSTRWGTLEWMEGSLVWFELERTDPGI